MIRTESKNTKENLCDTCANTYPDCINASDAAGDEQELTFGDGVGNDNIIGCNTYVPKSKPGTFITFGQRHAHGFNGKTFDCNCVAFIPSENEEEGREKAFQYFQAFWHNSYFRPNGKLEPEILNYYPRGVIKI